MVIFTHKTMVFYKDSCPHGTKKLYVISRGVGHHGAKIEGFPTICSTEAKIEVAQLDPSDLRCTVARPGRTFFFCFTSGIQNKDV